MRILLLLSTAIFAYLYFFSLPDNLIRYVVKEGRVDTIYLTVKPKIKYRVINKVVLDTVVCIPDTVKVSLQPEYITVYRDRFVTVRDTVRFNGFSTTPVFISKDVKVKPYFGVYGQVNTNGDVSSGISYSTRRFTYALGYSPTADQLEFRLNFPLR